MPSFINFWFPCVRIEKEIPSFIGDFFHLNQDIDVDDVPQVTSKLDTLQ